MTDRRRLVRLVAIAIAGFVVLYTGVWFFEASQTRRQIKHFERARAAEGILLESAGVQIRGFPFLIEAQFPALRLSGMASLPKARIEAPLVTARARPWRPNDWLVAAPQGMSLVLPDEAGGARLDAHELKGEVQGAEGSGWELSLRAGGLGLSGMVHPVEAASAQLHLVLPAKPPDEQGGEAASFDLMIDRLKLPARIGPLDRVVDRIALDGEVDGAVPPEGLRQALAEWRDAGGTVELRHCSIAWQKLKLDGSGTLALDKDMQPLASFSATLRGWPAMLDALVAEGAMKRSEANFARIGLSLLARGGPGGGNELKAPITLQNGHLYIEKARVARLPQITWPEG